MIKNNGCIDLCFMLLFFIRRIDMKKLLILFLMFGFFFTMQNDAHAQRRKSSRAKTSTFRFTDDMVNKINNVCPKVLKNASTIELS